MLNINILGWTFLLSISINLIFFVIAFIVKTDKFTDITYSLTFAIINLFLLLFNIKTINPIQILVLSLVWIWAFRLGTYLLIRIIKIKKDKRFNNIRNSFFKFLSFWIIQAITAYIVSLPTIVFASLTISFINDNFYYLAILLLLPICFLIYESIADTQKYIYHLKKTSPFLNKGLYKFSRFPNYFAEITFWTLVSIFELIIIFLSRQFTTEYIYFLFLLLSPLSLFVTIVFISGIKLLDLGNIKKYKDDKEYINYVKNTSMLIPFIGKKGFSKLALIKTSNKIV